MGSLLEDRYMKDCSGGREPLAPRKERIRAQGRWNSIDMGSSWH